MPTTVPADGRTTMSTPLGVLINELQMSPELLLRCLGVMVDYVAEVDTGRFNPSSSDVCLYIVRLVVRVEEFALYLIWHDDWRRQHAAAAADEAPELLIGSGWATAVRGLKASSADAVERIRAWQQQIRGRIDDEIFPMIQRWTIDCTKNGDLEAACILRAHMAYCYKNVRASDLDFRAVSTLLSSQIFITSRYTFELDSRAGEALKRSADLDKHVNRSLGIPQTELFQLWQKHRGKLVAWLRKSPQLCNEVMESIIRVATLTGTRAKPRGASVARAWQSMARPGCFGRFIPDTEVETARRAFEEANIMSRTFMEWLLRTTTQSVDTEINVQFGEFTLKKHLVTSLAPSIASQPDFIDVRFSTCLMRLICSISISILLAAFSRLPFPPPSPSTCSLRCVHRRRSSVSLTLGSPASRAPRCSTRKTARGTAWSGGATTSCAGSPTGETRSLRCRTSPQTASEALESRRGKPRGVPSRAASASRARRTGCGRYFPHTSRAAARS